jgi:hypothetical protein
VRGIRKSKHSRRIVPTSRSQWALVWGDLGGVSQHPQPKSTRQLVIELSGEDRVPIMNEKPISVLARDGFSELLCGPLCRGVGSHIAVQNPPRTQFQNDEYIEKLEAGGHRHQEVAGDYSVGVIAHEYRPLL